LNKKEKILKILLVAPCSTFGTNLSLELEDYLKRKGIEFKRSNVYNGTEAARLVNNEKFDFVIVDTSVVDWRVLRATLEVTKREGGLEAGANCVLSLNPKSFFLRESMIQKKFIHFLLRLKVFELKFTRRLFSC
jgi:hypothetical protein